MAELNCGDCRACCRGRIALSEEEARRLPSYQNGKKFWMQVDDKGWCVNYDFVDKQCSIYEQRPQSCRKFDCRDYVNDPNAPIEIQIAGLLQLKD